jgi:outer membrane protein assembly factor BamA
MNSLRSWFRGRFGRSAGLLVGALVLLRAAPAAAADGHPGDLEPGLLPLVGGDSDFGLGVGVLGSLARLGDPVTVNRWKLSLVAVQTFKVEEGEIVSPYRDFLLSLTTFRFPVGGSRLVLDANYTDAQLYYPGLGNASTVDAATDGDHYVRRSLLLRATLRTPLTASLYQESGMGFTHNDVEYAASSRIVRDGDSPDAVVRGGARLPKVHGVPTFIQAIGWDSRDADVGTSRGWYHRFSVRVAPGGTDYAATPYLGFDVQLRGYHTLVKRRWVVAWRALGDVLLGDPPTYELGRHESGWAIGGVDGLRGVPAQRYYGAVKGLVSVENRVWFAEARILGQRIRFGAAGFCDVGRVFATTAARPDLDGGGHGLKYGCGGGPRLAEGGHFEARVDVAYSPDADPVGIYVGAGQSF